MTAGTISFTRGEDPLRADKLNSGFNERLLRAGDSMLGPLVLSRDPVLPFEASTKQYIDALVTANLTNFLSTTGGTLTGFLTLHADPVNPMHAVTKHYVDLVFGSGGFISDAPNDGKAYGRASTLWTPVLRITGGTLTGNLIINSQALTIGLDAQTFPALIVNGAAATARQIVFSTASKNRWVIVGDNVAEGGSNAGTNLAIVRYADDGTTLLASALNISRATGLFTIGGRALVNGATDNGSAGLQVVGGVISNLGLTAGINGTSYPTLLINGANGSDRQILYQTNGVTRWSAVAGASAESGSNAGSDYVVSRFNDAGSYLGSPLVITRATGLVVAANGVSVAGGPITNSGGRIISQFSSNNPSVCVYDTAQTYAAGMFLGSSKILYFGAMDGNGNYTGPEFGHFDVSGNLGLAANCAVTGTLSGATITTAGVLYINYPSVTDFWLGRGGGFRYLNWATNWNDTWRESDGLRSWVCNNTTRMTLDINGNLGGGLNDLTTARWICSGNSSYAISNAGGPTIFMAGGGGSTYIQYATNLLISAQSTVGENINMLTNAGSLTYNTVGAYKPSGGPWIDSSDARIKRVTGDYKSGLAEILKLEPRRAIYLGNDVLVTRENWASHSKLRDADNEVQSLQSHHAQVAEAEQEFICFVAQEAEQAMPEMVSLIHGTIDDEFVDDLRVVDTQPLLYAMVNAFKELDARLQQLENRG